jgi:uncharacterized membrane protein YeaQ/YmgE (transglycosylase-associated protein family)
MTIIDVVLLLVAAVCGTIDQAIGGYSRGGCLVSIALGFIGAWIGIMLARFTRLPELCVLELEDVHFPIIWSIIGATLFVLLVGLLRRRPADY